jgi:hypothetical protein
MYDRPQINTNSKVPPSQSLLTLLFRNFNLPAMYRHPSGFRPSGGGGGGGWGSQQQQQQQQPPAQASPLFNPNFGLQNPNYFFQAQQAFTFLQQQQQQQQQLLQNPNFPIQNLNFPIQNPTLPPETVHRISPPQNQTSSQLIDKVDRAVTNARRNLISAGENVTAWKVSQDALLKLKVESWTSLGFPMQEVPSLHRLMLTEGKVGSK